MQTSEVIRQCVTLLLRVNFYLWILIPYYYLEAIYKLFVPDPPKSVKGEIVLITGTGHGMGKLLALKYAKNGAIVVGWDINEELNDKTLKEIKKLGYKNVYGYKCDVSNRENVMEVAKKVQRDVGDVTILINNAGIMPHHSFFEHTDKEIQRVMDINVMGNFWTLQAFLPAMRRRNHGHIVALSSMAGLVGCVNLVPYNASKFAVKGIMEGLYDEFRRIPNNKIQFTTIYPFMVDTGLCKNYDIAYDAITPILRPEFVVEEIFKAQTNNKRNVILPTYFAAYLQINPFWPEKAVNIMRNELRLDLGSDLEIGSNRLKKSS